MENENFSGPGTGDARSAPTTPDEKEKMANDDVKVKFTNATNNAMDGEGRNGDAKVDIEQMEIAFAGMGKDELMKFANDPAWIRARWILFIGFWLVWLAMLIGAVVIIVQAPGCPPLPNIDWWQKTVVYQIYPRSFQDSNNDGVGDLKGIESRLDYLSDVGVGAIWLSPIYKSPMKDFGYDIEDFTSVHNIFGGDDAFKNLSEKVNEKEMKLILDFVPNHTSNLSKWFENSRKRIPPYDKYYIWKDGKDGGPPNNWLSVFGGSAWTFDNERKQYYLHQFLPEQPDLDLRNPDVVDELSKVLEYWLELGVSGFRVDAIDHMFEDSEFEDEPPVENSTYPKGHYASLQHIFTKGQPENLELIRKWRQLLDKYSEVNGGGHRLLMVEIYGTIEEVMKYYGNETEKVCDFPFNFQLIEKLNNKTTAEEVEIITRAWLQNLTSNTAWPNWVLGNHDKSRVASRVHPELVDGLHMITMLLPGTAITYYGEEIGMQDGDIPQEMKLDKAAKQKLYVSRDPERTPMQWDDSENAGFTNTNVTPWLPVNENYKEGVNVKFQLEQPNSHLKIYKNLVKLRKQKVMLYGSVSFLNVKDNVFGFSRVKQGLPGYLVLVNFGNDTTVNLESQPKMKPAYTYGSGASGGEIYQFPETGNVELRSANVPTTSPLYRSNYKAKLSQLPLGQHQAVLIKFVPRFE